MSELQILLNKSRLNQGDIKKISDILSNENINEIGDYLMQFSPKVSKYFFEDNFDKFSKNEYISPIVSSILKNEKFLNNTRNDAISRTFPIIGVFLREKIYLDCIADLFIKTIVLITKKTPISNTCDSIFFDNILSVSRYNFLELNFNLNEIDIIEKESLFNFFTHLMKANIIDENSSFFLDWSSSNNFKKIEKMSVLNDANLNKNTSKMAENINYSLEELLSKVTNIEKILTKNDVSLDATSLDETVGNTSVQEDISSTKIEDLQNLLAQEQAKTLDLENRLKEVLQMDSSTNNQEIIKLKNEIATNLKLEYNQFEENKNSEYSVDIFEANRGAIIRIFRTLKRLGIEF